MINKKIALSAFSIVTVVALVGGATFALFNDQAQAEDSTFASGDADLKLALGTLTTDPSTLTFTDSVPAPDFSGLYPGYQSNTGIWLKNDSSAPIDLDLVGDIANLDASVFGNDGINHLQDNLLVKWTCDTDGNDTLDETPTAEFSVKAWFEGGNAALGTLGAGDSVYCQMSARVPSSATNNIAGDEVTFDTLYDGTQDDVTPTPVFEPSED